MRKIIDNTLQITSSSHNNNLIEVPAIKSILEKYNIGKKPLSNLLGLGEVTVIRYLEGQRPSHDNSNLLKEILTNPFLYELFLLQRKDKITATALKKSLIKTKEEEKKYHYKKLFLISFYILKELKETTILNLQRIIYLIDFFSNKILKEKLIDANFFFVGDTVIYKEINTCFSYFTSNLLECDKLFINYDFSLTEEEIKYLDSIISIFGNYSPKILQEMLNIINKDTVSLQSITSAIQLKKYSIKLYKKVNKNYERII